MEDASETLPATSPALSQPQAICLLVTYCAAYVLPLYVSPSAKPSPGRSRDAPEAIRARIRIVCLATTACSFATLVLLLQRSTGQSMFGHSLGDGGHIMGYWPLGLGEAGRALFLTTLLFAAPLYESIILDGAWQQWLRLEPLRHVLVDWPAWRNIVAGPVTEECLFRSAAIPLLLLANFSLTSMIFLSPLVFGLAHVHHFYEFRITNPRTPMAVALMRSLFQLTYTSMFGAYATFVFLRTGSLLAVIVVHAFCNSMGLPRVWGHVEPYWLSPYISSTTSATLKWTCLYYILLVGGSYAWLRNLHSLTLSPMALTGF